MVDFFLDFPIDGNDAVSYYRLQIPALVEAETFMRFILSALLVLTLAACASQGPTTNANSPASQQANLDALTVKLDDEDRRAIAALPKDGRRVKPAFAPEWDALAG